MLLALGFQIRLPVMLKNQHYQEGNYCSENTIYTIFATALMESILECESSAEMIRGTLYSRYSEPVLTRFFTPKNTTWKNTTGTAILSAVSLPPRKCPENHTSNSHPINCQKKINFNQGHVFLLPARDPACTQGKRKQRHPLCSRHC